MQQILTAIRSQHSYNRLISHCNISPNGSQTGALLLFLLILLNIHSYEVVLFAYSFNSGDLGVFQCVSIVLAATDLPTMITKSSPLFILCIRVLSPKHNLRDNGKFLPIQLLKYSKIVLLKGWIIGHSQMQCIRVPTSNLLTFPTTMCSQHF